MYLHLEDESDSMDGTSGTDPFQTSTSTEYRDKIPSYFRMPRLGYTDSVEKTNTSEKPISGIRNDSVNRERLKYGFIDYLSKYSAFPRYQQDIP